MIFNLFKRRETGLESLPAFWKTYHTSFEQAYDRKTPIEDIRFVCFDTETTGLDPQKDQILSLGAIAVQNWEIKVSERLEFMVHQEYQPVGQAIEVHGILPKKREESLSEREAVEHFLAFIRQSVLIGHHVGFDINMINIALSGILKKKLKLKNASVDTINLAKRLLPPTHHLSSGELSLDQLAQKYQLPMQDRHTAAGDAYMTAILFLKMLDKLEKRGNKTLSDLLRK